VSWQKENGGAPSVYVVSRGDTLGEIAERFNVPLAQLKIANHLDSNTIHIGQELTIPNGMMSTLDITFVEHTIARGETLSGIAENYRIPLDRIRDTNQLNSDTIRVGQKLKIPSW